MKRESARQVSVAVAAQGFLPQTTQEGLMLIHKYVDADVDALPPSLIGQKQGDM